MITAYFDGSCGPGPGGTAAYGFVVKRDGETIHAAYGRAMTGPTATCNLAEYSGLYAAMQYVQEKFPEEKVVFYGDSTLVINQMNGVAKAKKGHYVPYYEKSIAFAAPYIEREQWSFEWIPRGLNSEADELSQYMRFKPRKGETNESCGSIDEKEAGVA